MKKITKELKRKTALELRKEIQSLRVEIAKLELGAKANPQKDSNFLTKKKKLLARNLTVLTEKEEENTNQEKIKNI
ncbi:hypothetical protein COS31_02275 [Candidatus Roizmanbacteria bacterium CG02_land_8_20_14_3_00_36_15]|uniref:Large ribosomal subunit protein uL29 n=2 Tax=Candidatus Roizmaniibacteriota TaxID=1752723 RepID=A0A2M8KLT1_9BACT|nr:MAG: hypothetical protein COS51_03080 [Candidatus Roizmanbacteria bacterium CG03_land_8_20_14_0_80_36_21]PIV37892.1 MAG: hypothetical protein COS31_02275 [Candidatus Roizmanbacteria bacterium CG02_land_8_20_14_3_00_36_15]PIY69862.1 MAG: hypothetical protein COY89_03985 [Candidatus Roizmanbacteria bacterium CG_4_10_14_0_8_um_filter_36_36]PJA53627.1 MAG: hypothetical protein CO166_01050 [Candidatus Roizmanbacteria bacterium CG_4_9_14_3_um_filter_36_11]PJC81700.1 MAG: hypothetical protein CO007